MSFVWGERVPRVAREDREVVFGVGVYGGHRESLAGSRRAAALGDRNTSRREVMNGPGATADYERYKVEGSRVPVEAQDEHACRVSESQQLLVAVRLPCLACSATVRLR